VSKQLSIVLVCYNKWNFTKSCLKDLAQLPGGHEIIVIDNASSDETNKEIMILSEELLDKHPSFRFNYFRNEENTFHSKACNKGFRRASGENVLFLNNDIRVKFNHETWTQTIIDACNSTDGLVGPTMGLLDKDLNFVKESNQQLSGNSYLGGWCIAASKANWKKLDLDGNNQIWNEEFPFYFNDTDLSFRARKNEIPLTVIGLPDVVHFGKVSAAQVNIRKLYTDGRSVFLKHWGKNK
jgi:GT2 family glycosyltransferase